MGGDHAPAEIVAGAIAAADGHGMTVILTGRPSQLRPLLGKHHEGGGDIMVAPADELVAMDEGRWRAGGAPGQALRSRAS